MTLKKVQLNKIVKNQLPEYVREDFPLVGEFLSAYYEGQEYQGGPIDLINNIDSYINNIYTDNRDIYPNQYYEDRLWTSRQ